MAFPVDPLDIEVSLALSADLSDPGSWSWTDITDFVQEGSKATIRRGRIGAFTHATASRCGLVVDNTDGRFSRHNKAGVWYGQIGKNTPLRVRINNGSGYVTRFVGYVTGWPPTWDASEADQKVPLSADGIMRRLGRDEPLGSTMRRYLEQLTGTVPVASWTLEDGLLVSYGTPIHGLGVMQPFVGIHPSGGIATFPQWSQGRLAPWLPTVVSKSSTGGLSILWATVSMPGFTNQWAVDFVYNSGTDAHNSVVDANPSYLVGGPLGWPQLGLDPENERIYASFGGLPEQETTVPGLLFDSRVHHVRWHAIQDGADVDWTIYIDGVARHSGTHAAVTLAAMTHVAFSSVSQAGTTIALGYASVWTTPASVTAAAEAAQGYVGELVGDRVQRLCDEEGIPVTIIGDSDRTMGPQQHSKRLLDLLTDCQTVEDGILFEPLDPGLAFLCQPQRINRTPSLTLRYDQRHISPPWEPIDDDREFVNSVTATRPEGYPQLYEDEESIARVGKYPSPVNPNTETDEDALELAGWLTALGTVDELRWPAVRPNLRGSPELIDDWLATDIGDVLAITGHPSPLVSDDILQVIEGYTEVLGSYVFEPTLTLTPAAIYHSVGRWALLSHELHVAINDSTTSIEIANTDVTQPMLATSAADIGAGYGISINGEDLTLTAVAASTPAHGAAGAASHANNASVTPSLPASVAAGHLLLLFAAIRNSGAGVPQAPAGYTRLAVFPATANCQLFAKIAGGSETNPTVTFTGGVANADTSAIVWRVTGKWHSVNNILIGAAACLNASAQNVTYPGLSLPVADNCHIVYIGWKQDDQTNIDVVPGVSFADSANTTTGDDQSFTVQSVTQTTATAIPSGAFVWTGGASAISRGAVVALRCDYQTATVTRSVNGVTASHAAGDDVTVTKPMRWGLV